MRIVRIYNRLALSTKYGQVWPHISHVFRGVQVVAAAETFVDAIAQAHSLAQLPYGVVATVIGVDASSGGAALTRRLAEIGFLPGEQVRVMARVVGGDPIAVRIGTSTFALRRHEAACVRVRVTEN